MVLALLFLGLALLLALVASLFIPLASTGGSAFAECWPFLGGPLVLFLLLAVASLVYSRVRPEAWIFRSVWPVVLCVLLLGGGGALFVFGVLV